MPAKSPALRALALLVVCHLAVASFATAEEKLFTPADVARIESVASTAISPDGRHVAYILSKPRIPLVDDDGPAFTELHVVDAEGNSRPYITGKVNISSISWTPDGKSIAYLANRGDDEHRTLYTLPLDGGESTPLVAHDSDIVGYSISAADGRVAFLAKPPLSDEQQKHRDHGFNQQIYEEDWRPTRVWLVDPAQADDPKPLELTGSASLAEWSPTGTHLAVVLAPTPLVDDSYMFKRVSVVDALAGNVVQQVNNPGKLGEVRWSPDGKYLAMNSGIDINDPREGHLMITPVPGDGELKDLTPGIEAHVDSFAWQDEGTLLYLLTHNQSTSLHTVSLTGATAQVPSDDSVIYAGLSLSDDGTAIALHGATPQHPNEVFLRAAGADQPTRVTTHNPWLAERRFARQEVVRYSARDGLDLEGVLVYPLNYTEGHRYPLIMLIHGGPESHIPNGWLTSYSYPGQVGAARGFAIFHPNYRGSTGRGVEFSKMGQADAAGKEFDDIVDAVDHLVSFGVADRDKVGITGGSYGGYASAWGATYYSDRYAASVMFVGISDNVSKLGTTDIPEEMYLVHHRKRLWDDWDYFLERSPIRHIEKNRTPTLILHGKQDPRVHPSQSLEFFRHLKTLDQAPARLILYEGEGHGNRKAAARFDYSLRLLRWMEHYLQGPGGDPPSFELDYESALGTPGD